MRSIPGLPWRRTVAPRAWRHEHASAHAVLRFRVTDAVGPVASRISGTFRARATGCGEPSYESWVFLGTRSDLPGG
jgi:hypothetical protein